MRIRPFNATFLVVACAALLAPGGAYAQQYFDPGLLQKTIEQKPQDFQAVGARWGSFMFHPGVELSHEWNDNIFYFPSNEIDDTIWHVRPWFSLTSDWNRHAVNLSGWADIARYNDFDVQDYEDWALRLDGRIDVRRESWFTYEVSNMHLHEDRRNPDDSFGLFPTEFDYSGFGGGYDHVFNRLKAGVYFRRTSFDYENNVDGVGDIIDNQDRDRDEDTLSFRIDYQVQPERSIFFTYASRDVSYDQILDRNKFQRSSDGHALSGGVNWDLTGVLEGDLFLQYNTQEYDDPRLNDVDGFSLGAGLTWTPTQKSLFYFRLAGGPQETTQPDTSGYMSRLYSVRFQHELRRNWLVHARLSYTDNDYETDSTNPFALQDTQVTRAGASLSYLFNRNFYLSGGYVYEDQDGNAQRFVFSSNRFFLTLGLEL